MPGGNLQLISYNNSNDFLCGNPQITFFKSIYKKYTNFSIISREETLEGDHSIDNLKSNNIFKYKFNNLNGDLLYDINLRIKLDLNFDSLSITEDNDLKNYLINFGHNIINYAELSIGNNKIDKITGEWLQIKHELMERNDSNNFGILYNETINSIFLFNFSNLYTKTQLLSGLGVQKILPDFNTNLNNDPSNDNKKYYACNYKNIGGGNCFHSDNNNLKSNLIIPLKFWFCNKPGLALPLLSILYDEVSLKLKLNSYGDFSLISDNTNTIKHVDDHINKLGFVLESSNNLINDNSIYTLLCDYIFLDKEEKKRFQLSNHQYLIEQVQYQENNFTLNDTISNLIFDLNFNHCIKELIWVFKNDDGNYYTEFNSLKDHSGSIQLLMNKHSRFEEQNVLYFTRYQPYKYHSGRGGLCSPDSIFVYSFSIYPEKFQPSGVCNFNECDLQIELNDIKLNQNTNKIKIYAVNYNILKISSGTIKLLYGK